MANRKMKYTIAIIIFSGLLMQLNAQIINDHKNIKIPIGKEIECSEHQKFIEQLNLKNLISSKDSFSIRFQIWTLSTINSIFEIKCVNGEWSGKEILYGIRYRNSALKLLLGPTITVNKSYQIYPLDSTWDFSMSVLLDSFNLFSIRDQSEIDNSMNKYITDGIGYILEVSTVNKYSYISWSNPDDAPMKSFDSETIRKIHIYFGNNFTSKLQRQRHKEWLNFIKKHISNTD